MLEPQSTALFVLLMVLFGLLAWWMVKARQPVLRLLAACLAFLPAVMFGVVAVNKYYGYYQTWSAAIADFGGQGAVTGSPMSTVNSGTQIAQLTKSQSDLRLAQQQGYTVRMTVAGKLSHITRAVYVYLPPQYFQPAYQHYRFPVMELIHGQPGAPQDWINLLDVNAVLNQLVTQRRAKPVVLVMPDANGAENISLQCLNQVGGPQDLTYLAQDLPAAISRRLRVTPPGPSWAIAGVLRGRVLRGQHGAEVPRPVRLRRRDERLLQPAHEHAAASLPRGQPVRRQPHAEGGEHPAARAPGAAAHRQDPVLLARRRHGQQGGRVRRRDLLAGTHSSARRTCRST